MFQLDDDDKSSSVDTARDVMEASSTQGFPRYKKPLPAISTGDDDDDGDDDEGDGDDDEGDYVWWWWWWW